MDDSAHAAARPSSEQKRKNSDFLTIFRMPLAKYALTAIGVLAVVAVAIFIYSNHTINVQVATIERDVPIRVFGLGTTEARVLSKIGFEVGATLTELHADHGDRVSKGQVLARLSTSEQDAKVAKARALLLICRGQYYQERSKCGEGACGVHSEAGD